MFTFNPEKRIARITAAFDKMVRELDAVSDETDAERGHLQDQLINIEARIDHVKVQRNRAIGLAMRLRALLDD